METKTLLSIILLIVLVGVAVGTLVYYYVIKPKKNAESGEYTQRSKGPELNAAGKLSRMMKYFPGLGKYRNNLRAKLLMIDPGDDIAIDNEVGAILTQGLTVALGLFLIIVITTFMSPDNGVLVIGSGLLIAYVTFDGVIENKVHKLEHELLKGLSEAMTQIRHYYEQTQRVDDAVYMSMPEQTDLVRKHLQLIYDVLMAPNPRKAMDHYNRSQNNPYLQLLLATAVSTKEYGDTKTEDGSSSFLKNTELLKEEMNAELIREQKNDNAFAGIMAFTVGPIALMKPFEIWATTNMPMITPYYQGVYGTVAVVVVMLTTALCYSINRTLKEGSVEKRRDDSVWAKLAEKEPFSTYLESWIGLRKNYTKYLKYDRMLKGIGDHTGTKALLLKQCTYGVAAFILSIVLFVSGAISGRILAVSDFTNDFKNTVSASDEYKTTMNETAKDMIKYQLSIGNKPNADELAKQIREQQQNISTNDADTMAEAIISHMEKRDNSYFRWWYIIVAIGVAALAYMTPIILLKMNSKVIAARQETEIMRYQSMMMILMYVPGTDLFSILSWMERFSNCFLESVTQCIVELGSGQARAIKNMKMAETNTSFRAFCDNLLSIDKVGVRAAFDEIASDRNFFMKKREQDWDFDIHQKSNRASKIAFIPFYAILGVYLMIPWIEYGMELMKQFQGVM